MHQLRVLGVKIASIFFIEELTMRCGTDIGMVIGPKKRVLEEYCKVHQELQLFKTKILFIL